MFSNTYIQQRINKAQELRDKNLNPYRNDSFRTIKNKEFLEKYKHLKDLPESKAETNETISGRVKFIRLMGKASFFKIEDESGILQAYLSKNKF